MTKNSISSSGTNILTQITFSSIIALGLMSFIIPSDVTLASTSMISQMNNIVEGLENRNGETDPFREKRGVGRVSDGSMDYINDDDMMNSVNDSDPYGFDLHPPDITPERGPWEPGPMKTISDSVFSLIILIYVSVIFVFMFFAFCWKEPEPPPPDPAHKNIPMITSMLDEMEKQMEENKRAEEERISIEKDGSIGNECTEMTELKNGIEKSKYDSASSINQSKVAIKSIKELDNNSTAISRKDAETIVVNVITEKSKSSASVNFKEEQV